MQVLFKSRHGEADELRQFAQTRLRRVFIRFGDHVHRATVQMSDVNGPRGGTDKRCQVEIRTDGAGTLVVASMAPDWRTALDNALARAVRHLMRRWRRRRDTRRLLRRQERGVAS